jgi:hypothetical protein
MEEQTTTKLAKDDYMLLFIRINSIQDQYNTRTNEMERVFKFEHVANRFAPNDHTYSTDKDNVSHCYREIEAGEYYMIFAHRVPQLNDTNKRSGKVYSRWVWRGQLLLTEKQIRKVWKFYEKHPDDAKMVGEFADFVKNPRILPIIEEFEY